MPITRHQAQALLTTGEMELFEESRSNPLRKLDAAGLEKRIERSRRARDRARDLVQKQKLASRATTGSKRGISGLDNQRSKDKAALLDDILKRFEHALTPPTKASATPGAVATTTTSASRTARKTAAAKRKNVPTRVTSPAAPRQAVGEIGATPGKKPARKVSARDVAAKKRIQAGRAKKRQDKKTARDHTPRSW